MNTQSNVDARVLPGSRGAAPRPSRRRQALYWSVRRELWENRSIYIAPLAVAAVALFAFSISAIRWYLGEARCGSIRRSRAKCWPAIRLRGGLMMLTGIIVGVFYCLDALHGERRDRSILFWKSLPVSDLTTVLSKASIPLVVLPLLTFAVTVAMQWIMLLLSSAVLLVSGQSVATLWTKLSFFRMSLLLLYHILTAHALWPAPVYCWLLLVSGWSRRATFLWAVLPRGRDCRCRADCLPYLAFRYPGGVAIDRSRASFRLHIGPYVPIGSHDTYHPG